MTDAQFGALLTALVAFGGGLIGCIRWAVNRITMALDKNTESHTESAKQMAILSTKIDFSYQASREVKDFMVEERSGVHDAPPTKTDDDVTPIEGSRRKVKTDPKGHKIGGGYGPYVRPGTRGGENE